jgi:ferredoxin
MKPLIYCGACDVRITEMPEAKIEQPQDVLVTTNFNNG